MAIQAAIRQDECPAAFLATGARAMLGSTKRSALRLGSASFLSLSAPLLQTNRNTLFIVRKILLHD
jgi:hypothetical protein